MAAAAPVLHARRHGGSTLPVLLRRALLASAWLLTGGTAQATVTAEQDAEPVYSAEGRASYYSSRLHGKRTASGEPYDETAMTAAHPSLPFGSRLCVTNLYNDRHTVVWVNDRGPFVGGRIIDLSLAAADELGMLRAGTARVRVESCEEKS